MKTFFRVSMLGLLMVVLTAFTSVAVMAQDDEQKIKTELYTCFVENFEEYTIPQQEKALKCAKDYIAKFPKDTQYVDYFKGQIPDIEKWIAKKIDDNRKAAEEKKLREEKVARLKRFDSSYRAASSDVNVAKWQEFFSAADDLISKDKEYSFDTQILIAASGARYLPGAKTPIDTFNSKILSTAETVIANINNGKTSENFGVYDAQFGTKEKTLAEMYEVIGFIKFERQGNKMEGVSQYFNALKYKKNINMYRSIGSWYLSKASKIGKIRTALDQKNEENLPKIKEYLAMERGYASRAIDAYARAYSLAKADSEIPEAGKQSLFKTLKELFEFRFTQPDEVGMKTDASINSYVATVNTKTMPSPSSEVKPIALEKPKPTEDKMAAPKDKMSSPKTEMKKDANTSTKNGATRSRKVSTTSPPKN